MQQYIDKNGILEVTAGAQREKVLRFRQELIELLRSLEDMHGIAHSVPPKAERERSTAALDAVRYKK